MMKLKRFGRKSQRGLTLLEISLALIVVAIVGAGISQMISSNSQAMQAKNDAEKLKTVSKSAQQYLRTNYDDLIAATGGGAVVAIPIAKTTAGGASPASPAGLPSLQDAGLLPESFIDSNSRQQNHALVVKATPSGDLDAIVTSYGGANMDDSEVSSIAALLGAAGGGVYNNAAIGSSTKITGVRGGWADDTANWNASIGGNSVRPSAGTVQVSMGLASLVGVGADLTDESKFLHKSAETDPSLNAMSTNLNMSGNNVNNVGALAASTVNAGTVTTTGAIAATGATSDITAGRNIIATGALSAGGAVMSGGASDITAGRDVVAGRNMSAAGSIAATSAASNITAGRDIIAGRNVTAAGGSSDVTAGRNVVAGADVRGRRFIDADNTSRVVDPSGTSSVQNMTVNGNTSVQNMTAAGTVTTQNLTVNGTTNVRNLSVNGEIEADIYYDRNNRAFFMDPNSNSRIMNLTASGNAVLGTNSSNSHVINGDVNFKGNSTTEGTLYVDNISFTSDVRLKENIEDIDGLAILSKLAPKSYTWKDDGTASMGLIAQEVEAMFPELVVERSDGMKTVKYIELIAPIIQAVQQLHLEVEALQ